MYVSSAQTDGSNRIDISPIPNYVLLKFLVGIWGTLYLAADSHRLPPGIKPNQKTDMRATIAQKLARRQAQPPGFLYDILVKAVIPLLSRKLSPTFTYKAFPGKDAGPFVLISNHASRIDYLYTAPVCWPRRLNYVVGYNEFFQWPTSLLLNAAGVIPKKNFTPDVHSIKQIMNIISRGGCICIMPEGMNRLLAHDDYIWNKEKQHSYDDNGDGMAAALDTLLYMCPKCGAMHRMVCEGDTMRCSWTAPEVPETWHRPDLSHLRRRNAGPGRKRTPFQRAAGRRAAMLRHRDGVASHLRDEHRHQPFLHLPQGRVHRVLPGRARRPALGPSRRGNAPLPRRPIHSFCGSLRSVPRLRRCISGRLRCPVRSGGSVRPVLVPPPSPRLLRPWSSSGWCG